jgi:hypothetical protein
LGRSISPLAIFAQVRSADRGQVPRGHKRERIAVTSQKLDGVGGDSADSRTRIHKIEIKAFFI